MDRKSTSLDNLIESLLSRQELAEHFGRPAEIGEESYARVFESATESLPLIEEMVRRSRARAEHQVRQLLNQPPGRWTMLLDNSTPDTLLALAHELMQASFGERFRSSRRSLELAEQAVEAAERVARSRFLPAEDGADLVAEALGYRANARRIGADLRGAARDLEGARERQARGTGDRHLKGRLLGFRAVLCIDQGKLAEAADLLDREIAIWRLVAEPARLASALTNRGLVATWLDSLGKACRYLREGAELTEDRNLHLIALMALAEALARQGRGLEAWRVLGDAESVCAASEGEARIARRLEWVKGITHRTLGNLEAAEEILGRVRDGFVARANPLQAGLVSLDLCCVYAAQGRAPAVRDLAEQALRLLASEGVEQESRVAVVAMLRAIKAEKLSEDLAVQVANFLARSRHDRSARFRWRGE